MWVVQGTAFAGGRDMRREALLVSLLLLGCNAGLLDARADADIDAVEAQLKRQFVVASCPGSATYSPTCGLVSSYTVTPAFLAKFKASQCAGSPDDACDALLAKRQQAWVHERYFAADWEGISCDSHARSCELRLLRSHDARLNADAIATYQAIEERRQSAHAAEGNGAAFRIMRGFSAAVSAWAFASRR